MKSPWGKMIGAPCMWKGSRSPKGTKEQCVTSSFTTSHAYIYCVVKSWVKDLVVACVTIDDELIQLSCPPSWIVYTCFSMWAYGNHYQVDLKTRFTHLTYDVWVACIFNQVNQSSMQDQNRITAIWIMWGS